MVELAARLFVAIVIYAAISFVVGSLIEGFKERRAEARRIKKIIEANQPPRIERDWMEDFNNWVLTKRSR